MVNCLRIGPRSPCQIYQPKKEETMNLTTDSKLWILVAVLCGPFLIWGLFGLVDKAPEIREAMPRVLVIR